MKETKGITLIALIITIIIMLILAGVVISIMISGGVFTQAERANRETVKGQYNEELSLIAMDEYTAKMGKVTRQDIIDRLERENIEWISEIIPDEEDENKIKVISKEGYNFEIIINEYKGIEVITNEDGIPPDEIVIPELEKGDTLFAYTPNTWTNGNVMVTINTSITGYDLEYSRTGIETDWTEYTGGIEYTENGEIHARLTNGRKISNISTGNVKNIDKIKPVVDTITASVNGATFEGTDTLSGIIAYGYSESGTVQPTTWTSIQETEKLTNGQITGLTNSKTYYIWVKDQAGNTGNKSFTTLDVPFEFIVTIPSNDLTYTLNLPSGSYNGKNFAYNFEVDWGDGTTSKIVSQADTNKKHTYTTARNYTVKITGIAEGALSFQNDTKLKQILTGFPKSMNVTRESFANNFQGCANLTGIPGDLFANTPNITSFYWTFIGCTSLTGSIPANLFAKTPKITDFSGTFYGCRSLTGIPDGLFANTPNVTSFDSTFRECTGLTGSIPANLFANTSKVTTFYETFHSCSNLTGSISAGLFANTPNVTTFNATFMGCEKLTGNIPGSLFANTPRVTEFCLLFTGCIGLTGSIPSNLFANTPNVTTFEFTFGGCTNLSGNIPTNLFATTPNVVDFYATFYRCSKLTGAALPLWTRANVRRYADCYDGCTGLSNYASIPAAWL